MLDTLVVLTQCYAAAIGVTPLWNMRIAQMDTTPAVLAMTRVHESDGGPLAVIRYNADALRDSSDVVRRTVVVHELLHVYWAPMVQAALYGADRHPTVDVVAFREFLEALTALQAERPFWQRLCGVR